MRRVDWASQLVVALAVALAIACIGFGMMDVVDKEHQREHEGRRR